MHGQQGTAPACRETRRGIYFRGEQVTAPTTHPQQPEPELAMTDNIPPEIADEGSAPAPLRISPEVRETILEGLRRFKGDDLERATHAFGRDPKGANAAYIDRLKASRAKIESAIAFVEALP